MNNKIIFLHRFYIIKYHADKSSHNRTLINVPYFIFSAHSHGFKNNLNIF